jgi:hypothetical protein
VSEYGLAGLIHLEVACDVYTSVASVLFQKSRERFQCPGGEAPKFKEGPGGRDNPLTVDVDESQASEATTTSTTAENSDSSTESTGQP